MKKFSAILLAAIIIFMFTSCGKDNKSPETEDVPFIGETNKEASAGTSDGETDNPSSSEKGKTEGETVTVSLDTNKTDNQTEISDSSDKTDGGNTDSSSFSGDTEQGSSESGDKKTGSGKIIELPIINPDF